MNLFLEVSLSDLYNSTDTHFPEKIVRSTSVEIGDITFNFLPPSTLLIRSDAHGEGVYPLTILLNNVKKGRTTIETVTGPVKIAKINPRNGNAQVFCGCTNFAYTCNRQNDAANSLYDSSRNLRPPYIKTTNRAFLNEGNHPGLCKHLIKLVQELKNMGVLTKL